jgi:hypothetical protein
MCSCAYLFSETIVVLAYACMVFFWILFQLICYREERRIQSLWWLDAASSFSRAWASTSVCLEISFDLAVRFGFLIFYPSSILWSAVILCRYCLWCILGFQYDITYCIASFRKMFKGRHWNLRYYVFILINIFLEYVSSPDPLPTFCHDFLP